VFSLKIGLAIAAMSACLWFAAGSADAWLVAAPAAKAARLSGVVVLGVASYFGALMLLGFRLRDFVQRAASASVDDGADLRARA
jgi:putative peptidoglycan lipid II flippase